MVRWRLGSGDLVLVVALSALGALVGNALSPSVDAVIGRSALFACTFLGGLFPTLLGGCGALCPCPETPERPEAQGPLPGLVVTSHDQYGREVPSPVQVERGTIEITGREVLVRYIQDSVAHKLVYDITGPRY